MTLEVIDQEIKDTNIHILKKATCPSLSGRSKLNYSIGAAEKEILIRIDKNSGAGKFNNAWHSLDTILDLICNTNELFNWSILAPIFKGQSVNTAGFIMAVLKKEGLIRHKDRSYEKTDTEQFMAAIKEKMEKPTTKSRQQNRRAAK